MVGSVVVHGMDGYGVVHGMDGYGVVHGMDGYGEVCSVLQDLLMLKATSGATITCIEQCLSLLQGNQVR